MSAVFRNWLIWFYEVLLWSDSLMMVFCGPKHVGYSVWHRSTNIWGTILWKFVGLFPWKFRDIFMFLQTAEKTNLSNLKNAYKFCHYQFKISDSYNTHTHNMPHTNILGIFSVSVENFIMLHDVLLSNENYNIFLTITQFLLPVAKQVF
jgi:hypothetical protein